MIADGGENWGAVDELVRNTIRQRAQVRGLLPSGPPALSPYQVMIPTVNTKSSPMELTTGKTQAPVRISCDFKLKSEQIDDASIIAQLALRAARAVAAAEDLVLTFGSAAKDAVNGVKVKDAGATRFLSDLSKEATGTNAVAAVQSGISALQSNGHFGPFSVLMLPGLWLNACVSDKHDNKKKIKNLLEEGEMVPLSTFGDDGDKGVVLSLGTGAFDFIEVDAPAVSMVRYDDGDLILRVEERIVLRVMDDSAAMNIKFEADTENTGD